jgi:FlaA1/EpsC-like NDP-sugar epimerase
MGLKRTPRYLLLAVGYSALVNVAFMVALLLRFEGDVPPRFWQGYLSVAPAFTILTLIGYHVAGLFHGLWRYASTVTLFQILKGVTLSSA